MSSSINSSEEKEKPQISQNEFALEKSNALDVSPEEEKRIVRKIDYKLVPFFSLLYLLSFLDRVNIGQAKLDYLERDLNLTGQEYNISLVLFFVGYVITETPSNVLIKRLRPSIYIPCLMVAWSIVLTLMGLVTNFEGLAAARFFLGLAESGLFPGLCLVLTFWYKREETNLRIAIFFSAATLSGAFGGLLAYGLSQMAGVGGKPGWAWIFIIEGLLTFVVGVIAFWVMPNFPDDSKFLSPRERDIVIARLRKDQGAAGEAGFSWGHITSACKDYRVWVYCFIYMGVAEPLYSLSLFIPTIIVSLGKFTRAESQLLSTPPYFLAFALTLVSAFYSDRKKQRGLFNVFWMGVTVIGYAILLAVNPIDYPGVAYFALFLCVSGVAPSIPCTISWLGVNIGPSYKRGMASGMMFTCGNSMGIVSSLVYFAVDRPLYRRGHAVGLGFAAMAVILSLLLHFDYKRDNARRDRLYGRPEDYEDGNDIDATIRSQTDPVLQKKLGLEGMSAAEIEALGDRHPLFRYFV
ncbi:uncharacterized protein JCM6883_001827 [Sporobolomyces salmoneus]|uniref:uncharacterized protein n=1 Tax=Sporobolomyces salmoneus TaxID=183962 RepID=UPI0031791C78